MRQKYKNVSIEELALNDSFYRYCMLLNDDDILYWNRYIATYPGEYEKIREAKRLVHAIHQVLEQRKEQPEIKESSSNTNVIAARSRMRKKAMLFAAAMVSLLMLAVFIRGTDKQLSKASKNAFPVSGSIHKKERLYSTTNGERKFLLLPDSTRIWLNAGSKLIVDEEFGVNNRKVELVGEAMFDVTHDSLRPFVVHTAQYDINILGTVFNVKAYAGEAVSETSLLKGKVEIRVAKNRESIILTPNQKAVIQEATLAEPNTQARKVAESIPQSRFSIRPLSYDRTDSTVLETAWMQNKLSFANESLFELKNKLERWFNVRIIVKDSVAGNYTFTGTFRNEDIHEVLGALQQAYFFQYTIEDNIITISK